MNESDKLEGLREGEGRGSSVYTAPYVSESSKDIYATPEVVETAGVVEATEPAAVVPDTHGLFSGNQAESQSPYGNRNDGYGVQPSYGNPVGGYGMQPPYGNQNDSYSASPYGNPAGGYDVQPPYGNQTGNSEFQSPYDKKRCSYR